MTLIAMLANMAILISWGYFDYQGPNIIMYFILMGLWIIASLFYDLEAFKVKLAEMDLKAKQHDSNR